MTTEGNRPTGDPPPGSDQPTTSAAPAAESAIDVVEEAPVTIDEVGEPDYETQEAARRGWLQELVRSSLALLFTLLLFATVAFACWGATSDHWESVKELLQILLPAETALLGSATGFYYGTRR